MTSKNEGPVVVSESRGTRKAPPPTPALADVKASNVLDGQRITSTADIFRTAKAQGWTQAKLGRWLTKWHGHLIATAKTTQQGECGRCDDVLKDPDNVAQVLVYGQPAYIGHRRCPSRHGERFQMVRNAYRYMRPTKRDRRINRAVKAHAKATDASVS